MTLRISTTDRPLVAPLDWETNHFGVAAAQLTDATLADRALESVLQHARRQHVQWLVWATEGDRQVPLELLERFAGNLVDRKATFARSLKDHATSDDGQPDELPVVEYTLTTATEELVELSIASGEHSRFHLDARLAEERFRAMYRTWIERSVAKELADAVLVVRMDERLQLAGMISVRQSAGVGTIGLVAVAPAARGRGIGSALIRGAHRWMRSQGAHEARVVTQLVNKPACRLYESSGYELARLQNVYHFWPQAAETSAIFRRAA
jgi:dTDP-4-amino-4,6-dideoxy-D-galactose acyltransferase